MHKLRTYYKSHPWFRYAALLLLCGFVLFLRRPDALTNPQFWAEDGKHWYGDAYTSGPFATIFLIYAGSLQVAMRILGSASTFLPLELVPLFFTIAALGIKLLPIILLHSKLFAEHITSFRVRLALTAIYLLMPNSAETHLNLTNIGWHLSLCAFMIICSRAPSHPISKISILSLLLVSVLTGPFNLFLFVIASIWLYTNRDRYSILKFLIVCVGMSVQLIIMFTNGLKERGTSIESLGASFDLFIEIIGKRIFATTIFGNWIYDEAVPFWALFLLTLTGSLILLYALFRSDVRHKLFILFTWLIVGASLVSPAMGGSWITQLVAINDRYWYFPSMSFFVTILWLAISKNVHTVFKLSGRLILVVSLICLPLSFKYAPKKNLDFKNYAEKFDQSTPGETICFPVNPDDGWNTCLVKK